ncbi:hypothetical protein DXC97_00090 [Lachnospiraceae bacterium TF09-5]|nr:hypothetical protein DXC97_00090 [Lachnospiraceae bacterium TF09-5]
MINKFNVNKTRQLNKINTILSLFYHKPKIKRTIELDEVRNILIVDFALMGDMIMDIPFIKNIRVNCPNARITMICLNWGEKILGSQHLVDEFIIFDGKNILSGPEQIFQNIFKIIHVLDQINAKRYEIGFEPKGDLRHTLFLHYTRCERTITYNYTGGEYLVTDSFTPKAETKHLIQEKLDILEMSGFKIFEDLTVPELRLSKSSVIFCNKFIEENNLSDKYIIGIHPGASNRNKQYRYYPQLVRKIVQGIGNISRYCFVVYEGPGEKEIVQDVVNELQKSEVQFLVVKRSIEEYIALVSICDYMICNDSAAGHIAAAYNIPVLIIFGPICSETAIPWSRNRIEYISHELDCKPCTLPACPLKNKREFCITRISVEEVYQKWENLFDKCLIK